MTKLKFVYVLAFIFYYNSNNGINWKSQWRHNPNLHHLNKPKITDRTPPPTLPFHSQGDTKPSIIMIGLCDKENCHEKCP